MICPICHNPMIVVEREKIELDYCINCSGVWFDSGELDLLLEHMGLENNMLHLTNMLALPEYKTAEKKWKCPICNQKMKRATIDRERKVLIDICPHGDGLWFDGGEINQIIAQCSIKPGVVSDQQSQILNFLGDTFRAKKSA